MSAAEVVLAGRTRARGSDDCSRMNAADRRLIAVAEARQRSFRHHEDAQRTGNPWYIWAAIDAVHSAGLPPPGWCLNYLGKVARRVVGLAENRPKDVGRAGAAALGFHKGRRGRGSVISDVGRDTKDRRLAVSVALSTRPGRKRKCVLADVADAAGVDVATVKRAEKRRRNARIAGPRKLLPR